MALKFRRGTTAQKSGSLAFGEPFVNTDLGTLQIGGLTGDITLGASGTGSTGTFGAISGSGLDITGNANIAGNLTLGGTITIGDNTSDNVVVNADLSSSIIPNNDNAFDLGSTSSRYRAIYGANLYGAINATNGVVSGSSQVVGILSSLNTFSASNGNTSLNSYTASNDTTNALQTTRIDQLAAGTASVNSFTSSQSTTNTANTARFQRLEESTASLNAFSASQNTKSETLRLYTASVDTKFSTLQTYTASNDTTNTTQNSRIDQLSTASGSAIGRLNNLETTSASVNISVSNINSYTASLKNAISITGSGTASVTTIYGALNVEGTTTTISASNLSITDNLIYLNDGSTITNPDLGWTGNYNDGIYRHAGMFRDASDNGVFKIFKNYVPEPSQSIDTTHVSFALADLSVGTLYGAVAATNGVVSGSAQVVGILSSLNTFSASALTRLSRIEESTSSLNAFSASENTKSETLRLYTASIDNKFSTLATTTASLLIETANLETFSASALTRLSRLEESTSSINAFTASQLTKDSTLQTYTASVDTKFSTLQTLTASMLAVDSRLQESTASLNAFSASENTKSETLRLYTASIDTKFSTLQTYTASVDTTNTTQNTRLSRIEESTSSLNAFSASENTKAETLRLYTASVDAKFSTLATTTASLLIETANLETFSASALTRFTRIEESTASLNAYTSSLKTAITIAGSDVTVNGNLTVAGTTTTVNSTTVAIADNILELNYGGSAVRAGLLVKDATAASLSSGSFLWDGTNDYWIAGKSGSESKVLLAGSDGVVSGSSQITAGSTTNFATDVKTQLNSNTVVSGSSQVNFTQLSGISANIISASTDSTNVDFIVTGGSITANLFGGVVSGSSQITAGSTTNFATDVKTQLNTNTVVSGSGQINVASTTGDIALGTRTSGNYVATITAGTGVSSTGATTGEGIAHTISIGQAVATSDNVRFNSIGVGMAASATAGRIDAANDVVAFSTSDIRFKENITPIPNAIEKIRKISGNTYDWKAELKDVHGYEGNDVGVIAQEIEEVLPQLVQNRDNGYKAVKYDKLVALLIEGIKEQQQHIDNLTIQVEELKKQKGL